jgi:branched-chain amino acid aminotransferase
VQDHRIVAVEHPDALPGITRDTLVALTGAVSLAVTLDELRAADEVFVCGTAAEVTPIDALDDRCFARNSTGRELAQMYQRVVRGNDARHRDWLTDV